MQDTTSSGFTGKSWRAIKNDSAVPLEGVLDTSIFVLTRADIFENEFIIR